MIKNLYCNGCSTMAGGGLEPIQKDRMKYYKEKFGLEWQSERDITWTKLVAEHMGYKLFDYSKSGAGIERYIREISTVFKLPIRRKHVFWANNFICHNKIIQYNL